MRLPFSFIITGIVGFVLFHVLTLIDFANWIGLEPRSPDGLFRVHLLVLGWATMIAMGAVYQLINVILQTQFFSEKLGFVHYGFFMAGTTGLLIGFRSADTMWIAVCAAMAVVGILLFAVNMGITLWKARQWNAITLSSAAAIAGLTLTGLLGAAMGLDLAYGLFGSIHERLFGAHIWLGAIGWFGLLIVGFSFKLLPMFYLAHDYPTRLQRWIVGLWAAASAVGAISFLLDARAGILGGLILLTAALALYNLHINQIRAHRHKLNPGIGIRWATGLARAVLAAFVAAALTYGIGADLLPSSAYTMAIWLYLYGWVALTILGYMSKIVPFLWWTHKYGSLIGKQKVPTMAQLLKERPLNLLLGTLVAALLLLLIGLGVEASLLIALAGCLLSIAALAYMGCIAWVFTR